MHAKDLFHELCSNYETYKQLHNQTVETDLKIIELFSKGKMQFKLLWRFRVLKQ